MPKFLKALECLLLFVGLPTFYLLGWIPVYMILLLVGVAGGCLIYLLADRGFERRRLWNAVGLRAEWRGILAAFALGAVCLALFTMWHRPEWLFGFPRRAPRIWVLVMLLYPLLSVYPQELVYRTFFFQRYAELFPSAPRRIAASALAFAYVHVIFENVPAVLLCLVGGALFAWRYERSRSTLAVSVEHALYGCFIFTIGLGRYFYGGASG